MSETILLIGAAVVAFATTNIDDIVILALWFAQVNPTFRKRHIVAGQYLGFAALMGLSLFGFVGTLIIPQTWMGLLGIVPIAIGLYKLLKSSHRPISFTPSLHIEGKITPEPGWAQMNGLLSMRTYSVAAVTLANGSDNISVYVPLFAGHKVGQVAVIVAVFLLLVAAWCYAGYRLARTPAVSALLAQYGDRLLPFVFIGLGIYILVGNSL
jgi:cadmium resistance transport/sequestration family protein